MSIEFTEGPWGVDLQYLGEDDCLAQINSEKHLQLASVVFRMDDEEHSPELEANAYLIAAAPDMYTALELLLEQYESSGDMKMGGNLTNQPFIMAKAALKKARLKR